MESVEEKELHYYAKNLTEKASNINEKIKNQDYIIESIQVNAENNQQEFLKNNNIFYLAMDKLNRDKRNITILFLFTIVCVLIYIIKNY